MYENVNINHKQNHLYVYYYLLALFVFLFHFFILRIVTSSSIAEFSIGSSNKRNARKAVCCTACIVCSSAWIAFHIINCICHCIIHWFLYTFYYTTTLLLLLLLLLSLCVFVDKKIVHNNIYYDNEWSEDNL